MKKILITGVSTGIGYASLRLLWEQGYYVFGSVRKEVDAERLKAEFSERFQPLLFDLTQAAQIKASIEILSQQLKSDGLSALINNAGIAVSGPLLHLPADELRHQFEVNIFGLMEVTRACLPLLGARTPHTIPPGKIINISSVSGRFAAPFVGPYAASKFALEALTDSLRRELLPFDIDVISIQPGPIKTPIWEKLTPLDQVYKGTIYEPVLQQMSTQLEAIQKRAIPPERVAKCIYKVLQRKRPRTRYIVAKHAWSYPFVFNLPARWADARLKSQFQKVISNGTK